MHLGYSPYAPRVLRAMARQYGVQRPSPGFEPEGAMDWAPPGSAIMRQAQIARGAYGFMPVGGRASGDETEGSGGSRGILRGARLGSELDPNPYSNFNCFRKGAAGANNGPVDCGDVCAEEGTCPAAPGWPWWVFLVGLGVGVGGTVVMGRKKR